jgi:hypothetical protein
MVAARRTRMSYTPFQRGTIRRLPAGGGKANRGEARNGMRQQPTFYRLDRSAAGGGRERPEGAASMMVPLPPGWLCLQDCNLSGQLSHPVVVPFVLMHPDVGVVLIDISPASNPEAEAILRRRLEAARFESIFPGFLPILHLRLDRADLPSTEAILRDAFAALPPLSVPGGDGWVSVVRRALLPRDPSRAAAHPDSLPAGSPAAEHAPRFPRRAGGAASRGTHTESDMLHREVAARAAVPLPLPDAPEPAARPAHPLPWIIMSGVGGLIAVLALFGLLNTGADTPRNTADEARAPAAPAVAAQAPASAPAASPVSPAPAPAPAPSSSASLQKPPPAALPSAPAPAAAPPLAAAAPPPPAASSAGASAAPAPAQRPAATAADRLPRITVRQPANLRTGPDSQANVVRVVPRGETLRVHGRAANGWVHVGDAEPRGWLHTSRLGEIEQ